MDYPYGHVGHHHRHNHRDDDDDPTPPPFTHSPFPPPPPHVNHTYPPPPPPHQTYPPPHSYGGAYNPPPPPSSFHSSPAQPPPHSYGGAYNPPPPHVESQFYPPTPQQPSYSHHYSSHESGGSYGGAYNPPPSHVESQFYPPTPQQPSYSHHGGPEDHNNSTHTYSGGPELGLGHLANRPSHKIHCKAGGERFVFGIRDGKVVLTHPDSSDLTQHWYKDEKYSTKVKDKDGHPSFMLVNKGTGQAVKHSVSCHPVQLAPYKPDVLDESVLWTESKDLGSGFRTIRTVNNVHLVMDAWNADKDHGGIHDGTVIALYETWKGDNQNQQWKFVRHCKSVSPSSESNC